MGRRELIAIVRRWALERRTASVSEADAFAVWYADHYPGGDKEMLEAFRLFDLSK